MADQPSLWSTVIAVALISGLSGYYISQFNTLKSSITSIEKDDTDESEEETSSEEHKLVLVVRTDLGMTKGKIAAQCGHATLACYKRSNPAILSKWESNGQPKIALKCNSEDELLIMQAVAESLNLTAEIIHDAGRTQIKAGSATVLGVGPGPKSQVDRVTGHLSLL